MAQMTEPSAIIEPTERSIPPVRITSVIPTAMMPLLETCRSTSAWLPGLKKMLTPLLFTGERITPVAYSTANPQKSLVVKTNLKIRPTTVFMLLAPQILIGPGRRAKRIPKWSHGENPIDLTVPWEDLLAIPGYGRSEGLARATRTRRAQSPSPVRRVVESGDKCLPSPRHRSRGSARREAEFLEQPEAIFR